MPVLINPNMKKNISLFLFILLMQAGNAQSVKIIATGIKSSMRGLSVVNDKTIWVSGSGGMVGKSVDSGNTWKWMPVKGFEKTEFRDIEAFDEKTAVIMAVDAPAYILRTIDGGENWQTVYENKTKGMFLDAMEFWNEESGIVIGDPIDNKLFIARTFDGGKNWRAAATKQNVGHEQPAEQKGTSQVDTAMPAGLAGTYFAVDPKNADVAFNLGSEHIIATRDGGKTWRDEGNDKRGDGWQRRRRW